jgi:hypothetical protein
MKADDRSDGRVGAEGRILENDKLGSLYKYWICCVEDGSPLRRHGNDGAYGDFDQEP